MDWSAMTPGNLAARFDAVLIGDPGHGALTEPLVRAAGGRVVGRVSWREATDLAGMSAHSVIVADLRAVGDAPIDALERIEAHRHGAGCAVVAIVALEQIDVAAALLGKAAQLLCEPDDLDIVTALTIAGGLTVSLTDILGESEAARYQRLNEEVARIAEVLAQLTKHRGVAATANDYRTPFDAGPSAVSIEAADIRRTIRARRLRDRQFGQGLFEDPAWDMLLDLFAAELEHGQVSVSSLCVAAAVAPTTALRWIGKLTDAGLFRREPDPFDRRRAFIELSPAAGAGMRGYVAAVRAAGLPIA